MAAAEDPLLLLLYTWLSSCTQRHMHTTHVAQSVPAAVGVSASSVCCFCLQVLAQPTANQVAFYGLKRSRLQPYTAAVDIWSVGVLISECLMGITPVGTSKREASDLSNHSFRGLNPPRPGMSSGCANFVAQVLAEQPEQRPTALQLLSHPWLVSYMAVEDVEAYASDAADW